MVLTIFYKRHLANDSINHLVSKIDSVEYIANIETRKPLPRTTLGGLVQLIKVVTVMYT